MFEFFDVVLGHLILNPDSLQLRLGCVQVFLFCKTFNQLRLQLTHRLRVENLHSLFKFPFRVTPLSVDLLIASTSEDRL
jgi:hypothetical protein